MDAKDFLIWSREAKVSQVMQAGGSRCCASMGTRVGECSNYFHRNTKYYSTRRPTRAQTLNTSFAIQTGGCAIFATLSSTRLLDACLSGNTNFRGVLLFSGSVISTRDAACLSRSSWRTWLGSWIWTGRRCAMPRPDQAPEHRLTPNFSLCLQQQHHFKHAASRTRFGS